MPVELFGPSAPSRYEDGRDVASGIYQLGKALQWSNFDLDDLEVVCLIQRNPRWENIASKVGMMK